MLVLKVVQSIICDVFVDVATTYSSKSGNGLEFAKILGYDSASLLRDDRQGEAFPTVSSLDAGHDRENIAKTSALPHESSPRVTSLDADEGSMQQRIHELMELCTSLQRQQYHMAAKIKDQDLEISGLKARVKTLEDKERRSAEPAQEDAPITGGIKKIGEELGADKNTELGSNDTEEMVNVLTSMEAANILTSGGAAASVSPGDVLPTVGVPTVSRSFPTASAIFTTACVVKPYTIQPRGITIGSSQPMRSPIIGAKDKKKVVESERVSEQLARDSEIARLHAKEELKMMIEGLDRNNKVIAKHLREYEQAAVDLSVREKLEQISELVKYQDHHAKILKYQAQQSKPLSKKEQKEFYMSVLRSHVGWKTKHFRGMTLAQIKEKFIPVWKQLEDFEPMSSKEESERLVPLEEVCVEALQKLDREDLHQLWTLVKETFSIKQATKDKEKELWVELKRLFEQDFEDQRWTHNQVFMHDPLDWKLYDTCGVHHVSTIDQEIFMLVEKDYPLRKGLATMMIILDEELIEASSPVPQKLRTLASLSTSFHCYKTFTHQWGQSKTDHEYSMNTSILECKVFSSGNSTTQQWNTFALTVAKCTSSGIIITSSENTLEHFIPNNNPHTHISNFKRMTATLKYRDVPNDAIKFMLFSYSLEGAARIWYEKEPPNSILTWDDLVNKFVNQFFPPSKITHLKNEISRFTQRFEETFGEAWDHFKEILRACPHHGFSELTQIDTFYNGLNEQDQDSLNAVTGGNLLNKTTREALKIIKNKSKASTSGTLSSNTVPNPKGEMKAVTTRSGLAYEGPLIPTNSPLEKSLLTNKDELFELAKVSLNENCSAMLLKKLSEKLGDPGKFHFPTDFVVVDFKSDPRVTLILGRSFLRTDRALIDVYGREITLRVNDEFVTFNLNQTMRYSSTYDDNYVNRVDVIDVACEEFVQDVLDFQYNSKSSNPTLVSDLLIYDSDFCKEPIVKSFSPTLTPSGESDLFLEEIEDFLNDESFPTGIETSLYDLEGDILYMEKLLNEDSFQLSPMDLKQAEETKAKSSIEEPPELELKELPYHLEYAFLEESDKLPVIIAMDLKNVEKEALIKVLKSHKRAIAWKISDIKGYFQIPIDPQDQKKTTFTCPYGTFAYRRMPFGLCNAPGHKISKSGIEVDRAKVDVIAKLPHPTTVKGVRSFLGHAGFYRRFIQDFSKIARPMTHLLEKETPFVFSK
nr:reverse transcriptase domain-containing protein [Tanacetum cinerariifolium]